MRSHRKMNKDNLLNIGSVVAIVALIAMAAVAIFNENVRIEVREQQTGETLGSALTYSAAMSKMEVFNFLKGISQDIGVGASASWNPSLMSTSTPLATMTVTVPGAAVGDLVLVSFDSVTSTERWSITGKVSAANTVMVTMELADAAASDSVADLDLDTSTVYVRVASSTVNTSVSATP